ncbi:MAG: hypothetical protein JSR44_10900 [Spirochaetes bacterium]|nr:hypothetical protein [Spirochaetota bacterium]
MIQRYSIVFGSLALAGLLFWGERFVVTARLGELAEARFTALQNEITALDRSITERNAMGDFFRYLVPGGDKTKIKLNFDFIDSVVVLDRNFLAVAASSGSLSEAERVLVKTSNSKNILTATGLLRRYDITDFESKRIGYIVVSLKPTLRERAATLVLANFEFDSVVPFSRDQFNGEEKKLIGALLSKQRRATESIAVRGTTYLSVRKTEFAENLLLFEIMVFPPFYTFISLYIVLLCALAGLVYIIHGHAAASYTRREISERILDSHRRAVAVRSEALAEIERFALADGAVQEKLVSTLTREDELEARIRAEREAELAQLREKKAPAVIEISIDKRDFRFMNPSRKSVTQKKAPVLAANEQKLRERAFSDELKNLMEQMQEPVSEPRVSEPPRENIDGSIADFERRVQHLAIDPYISYLNELYFDDVTDDEVAQALHVVGDVVQSREFAVMLYDARLAAFRTGFAFGAPKDLEKTFYLLPKDSIIQNNFADYGYVEFDDIKRQNRFFQKRFPATFSDGVKGVHIFALNEAYLRARIVFFDRSRGGEISDRAAIIKVRNYLSQLAPALHMYFSEHEKVRGNPIDLADWAVQELKHSVTHAENDPPIISQYFFEDALPIGQQLNVTKELTQLLRSEDKVLLLSPSHFVIAHAAGVGKSIEDILSQQGIKFIVKENEFGKVTRNLYTFIEF